MSKSRHSTISKKKQNSVLFFLFLGKNLNNCGCPKLIFHSCNWSSWHLNLCGMPLFIIKTSSDARDSPQVSLNSRKIKGMYTYPLLICTWFLKNQFWKNQVKRTADFSTARFCFEFIASTYLTIIFTVIKILVMLGIR